MEYARFQGLAISPCLKELPFKMRICEMFNVQGYVPVDNHIIACFNNKHDCEMAWGTMKMRSYVSRKLGIVMVKKENLKKESKCWDE